MLTIESRQISQEEPVHFRVNSFAPNTLPAPLSRPGEWVLDVHLDMPHRKEHLNFHLMPDEFTPYQDAIQEALRTQNLYWVDWNFENRSAMAGFPTDSTDRRLLQALENRQIIAEEAQQE